MPLISDAGAQARSQEIMDAIRAKARAALPKVAEALVANVKSRTPNKDQEYDTLMRGDGNPSGVDLVPRNGDQSGDTDGRTRFQKTGPWLEDVVVNPGNVNIDEAKLTVSIGNLALYMVATHWRYRNAKYGWHRDYGPYFWAFETGSVDSRAYVEPRFAAHQGGKYPLRPDEDAEHELFGMYKPVKARAMYSDIYLRKIVFATMATSLSE